MAKTFFINETHKQRCISMWPRKNVGCKIFVNLYGTHLLLDIVFFTLTAASERLGASIFVRLLNVFESYFRQEMLKCALVMLTKTELVFLAICIYSPYYNFFFLKLNEFEFR